MLSPPEVDELERRLCEIDALRAQNEARLNATAPHTAACRNYERQELESEAAELLAERQRTADQIRQGKDAHAKHFRFPMRRQEASPEAQRQQAAVNIAEQEQRAVIHRHVRRLETEGDFRQARLWRHQLIGLRERIAREFGFQT